MEAIHVLLRVRPEEAQSSETPSHNPPLHALHQALGPGETFSTPPAVPKGASTPLHGQIPVSYGGQSCVVVDDEKSLSVTGAQVIFL